MCLLLAMAEAISLSLAQMSSEHYPEGQEQDRAIEEDRDPEEVVIELEEPQETSSKKKTEKAVKETMTRGEPTGQECPDAKGIRLGRPPRLSTAGRSKDHPPLSIAP